MPLPDLYLDGFDDRKAEDIENGRVDGDDISMSGSTGSMVAGFEGYGQAARAPSFSVNFQSSRTTLKVILRVRRFQGSSGLQSFVHFRTGGVVQMSVGWMADDHWFMRRGPTGTPQWISVAPIFQQGPWVTLEFAVAIDNTVGRIEMRVDGSPDANLTVSSIDTQNTSPAGVSAIEVVNPNIDVDDLHIGGDNLLTWDAADFRTDGLGNPRVRTNKPNAAGTHQEAYVTDHGSDNPPGPLTPHVDEVKETLCDKSGTYILFNSHPKREAFLFEDLPVDAQRVHCLKFGHMSRAPSGGGTKFQNYLRIGGTEYLKTEDFYAATTYTHHSNIWDKYPVAPGTAEFTPTQVNALECGWINSNSTAKVNISQTFLVVQYSTVPAPTPPVPASGSFLLPHQAHRFTRLYKVEPVDALGILYLTEFPHELSFEGNTYTPVGGLVGSALQRQGELQADSMDVDGLVSAGALTYAHLRAGRFRDAKVTEYVVDWYVPWQGQIDKAVLWVGQQRFDKDGLTFELDGLLRWLETITGDTYSRGCRYRLGDARCTKQIGPLTKTNVDVASIIDPRRIFRADTFQLPSGPGDGYYAMGKLKWVSGDNALAGHVSEVKGYIESERRIELQLPTPYDIDVGDNFDIEPGCDFSYATCVGRHSNGPFFGGFRTIPGYKKLQK